MSAPTGHKRRTVTGHMQKEDVEPRAWKGTKTSWGQRGDQKNEEKWMHVCIG